MRTISFLVFAVIMSAQNKTVLDGVYTDAQASRGESGYGTNCAKCHEGADVDGPPLSGDPFIDRWREDSLASLFTFIKTNMPRDAAGKLGENVYLDILAYLLQANTFPSCKKELTPDVLGSTLLVGKDGPKPLPTNALVRVAGCFTQGPNGSWTLSRAVEPIRTRDAEKTTPEELKAAAAQPLGTRTFRLQNLDETKPDTYNGHKVQAKGVLIRQSNNNRINVTSLETIAPGCP